MGNEPNTHDRIVDAAKALLVDGGYNGFSYADISGVVGIRKASIHHHFPTKEILAQTVIASHRDQAEKGLSQLAQASPSGFAALRSYAGIWAHCIADSSPPFCVGAMLASEMPALPSDVAEEVQAFFYSLTEWVLEQMTRGQRDGSLALADPAETEASVFVATVYGAMLVARAQQAPGLFATITEPHLRRLRPAQ